MMQMKQNGNIAPLKYGPPPAAKNSFTAGACKRGLATITLKTNKTTVPIHGGDLGRGLLGAIEKDLEPCFGRKWLLGR